MGLSTLYNDEEPIPPMVSAFTRGWGFIDEGTAGVPPTSGTWESANRGLWLPIYVPTACIATRIWWTNGSTVSATYNVEAGLYYTTGDGKPGGKYWTTGSVAQGTASQVQFVDISPDIRLDPGLWWLFMSCSSLSATFYRSGTSLTSWGELFKFRQSAAPGSAPDPASPSEMVAGYNEVPVFGFSTNTVT